MDFNPGQIKEAMEEAAAREAQLEFEHLPPDPPQPDLTQFIHDKGFAALFAKWDKYRTQCPPVTDKNGKPCKDSGKIKDAWANVMMSIEGTITGLQKSVSGCNSNLDSMLNCLSNLPNTDFNAFQGPDYKPPLRFKCDSDSTFSDGTSMSDYLAVTDPSGSEISLNMDNIDKMQNKDTLAGTMLHELTHACGDSSELEANWIETLVYGKYGDQYPIDLNRDKNGNESVTPNMQAICCASVKKWRSQHGGDPGDGLVYGKNIVWDPSTGFASIFCDGGGTQPIDDFYNPLANQTFGDDNLKACWNVDIAKDCN